MKKIKILFIITLNVLFFSCDKKGVLELYIVNQYTNTIKMEQRTYNDSSNYVIDTVYVLKPNAKIRIHRFSRIGSPPEIKNIIFNDSVSIFYTSSDTFQKNMCYGSCFKIVSENEYLDKATYTVDEEDYQNALKKKQRVR
jgi:hypothetical protein